MGKGLAAGSANLFSAIHPDVYRHLFHLPLLSYTLLVPRKNQVRASKRDGFPPLILVHGLGGSRGDLLPMECYLRLRGRRGTYRVGLGQRSVAGMSRALARYVERVLKANQAEQVDIVAHSLGGVVARLAILDCGLESKVRTLVTMGTPHQGTAQVRYVDTRLTRELHPDSPTIQRLQDARWPKGVRGVTFWSKNDLLILPPTAAAEPGTDRIDMSPFTHFSYLIDPRSWAAVQNALTG